MLTRKQHELLVYIHDRLGETGRAMAAGPFAIGRHLGQLDRIYRGLAR